MSEDLLIHNSEVSNNSTDCDLNEDMIYITWLAAFMSRGIMTNNQSTLEFKFNMNSIQENNLHFYKHLHSVINFLKDNKLGITHRKTINGGDQYIIKNPFEYKSQCKKIKSIWLLLKSWNKQYGSINISLLYNLFPNNTNQLLLRWLYVYSVLRGKIFTKEITKANNLKQEIECLRIFGNKNILNQINTILYTYVCILNSFEVVPSYIYSINEQTNKYGDKHHKDYYIEISGKILNYILYQKH